MMATGGAKIHLMSDGTDTPEGRQEALLIVGPTGAGKTPLGDSLGRHGWHGRRCVHFDFGRNLRAVGNAETGGFTRSEIAFVQGDMEKGALLENETFHIAERILRAFIDASGVGPGELLVLNGLPRHVGQASDVDRIVDVGGVLHLDCTAKVVFERLRRNSGGDRGARTDDGVALVEKKLREFTSRTEPLVAHYRDRGATVQRWEIGVGTRPEDLLQA